jgi:hypothetical protein
MMRVFEEVRFPTNSNPVPNLNFQMMRNSMTQTNAMLKTQPSSTFDSRTASNADDVDGGKKKIDEGVCRPMES